jgi:dihydroorotate dehydrogenase (NAD+) catalytic subunit
VIGCGGVMCATDILEFMAVGCSAVQVGTASFGDPGLIGRLEQELNALLEGAGVSDVRQLIGSIRVPGAAAARAACSTVPVPASGR